MDLAPDRYDFAVQRYVFVAKDRREARLAMNMRRAKPEMKGYRLETPAFENEPSVDTVLERAIIGDAEHVAERIAAEAAEHRITHLSVFMQFASMPYARTLASMERFCAKVLPSVAAARKRAA